MKTPSLKAFQLALDGLSTFIKNLPLFARMICVPIAVTTLIDMTLFLFLKNSLNLPLLYSTLGIQLVLFLYFDTLFDITVSRFSLNMSLSPSFHRLTFGGAGIRTFIVNVKYFAVSLLYWGAFLVLLYYTLGLNSENATPALFQYFHDASKLTPPLYDLVKTLLLNAGILFSLAVVFFVYIGLRTCLAEPAAAVGEKKATLVESWRRTRSRGWFLARLLFFMIPVFIGSHYLETGSGYLLKKATSIENPENFLLTRVIHLNLKKAMSEDISKTPSQEILTSLEKEVLEEERLPQKGEAEPTLWVIALYCIVLQFFMYAFSFVSGVVLTRAYKAVLDSISSSKRKS